MKAWVLHDINDIRFEECAVPIPADNEVLVRVKAAGICGSDIPRIYKTGAHKMPLIPGHEFSGIVESAGAGVDSRWLNKRVGVFPLIPCRRCEPCAKGRFEMCRNYDFIGSRRNGAFAEYVAVPETSLIEVPAAVSYEEAAMLEPMAVAVHAMRIGTGELSLHKESVVAVCGLGTIGMLLIMFLLDAGYRNILAIGNKDFQLRQIKALGIGEEKYCDSKAEDTVKWLKKQGGSDLYFDCVGKNETASLGIEASKPAGRVVFVGNPASDMVFMRDTYWKILRNQLTVCGSWNSSFDGSMKDDWHYALDRIREGALFPKKLITHETALEGLGTGLSVMRDKTEDYCKIMMVTGD